MRSVYRNSRPILKIEKTGSKKGGNCYYINNYRIESTFPLSEQTVASLRATGALGYGQGFVINQLINGQLVALPKIVVWNVRVEPSGYDSVACIDIDDETGETRPAINPSNKKPYANAQFGYFIYEAEDHIDSSD